jgi:hypothetical protein
MELSVAYKYRKAQNVIQIMTYDDLLRSYELLINVRNSQEAFKFWSIIYNHINGAVFDSFSELNHAILNSIDEFKNIKLSAKVEEAPLLQEQQQQPINRKRAHETSSTLEPVQKRFKFLNLH